MWIVMATSDDHWDPDEWARNKAYKDGGGPIIARLKISTIKLTHFR